MKSIRCGLSPDSCDSSSQVNAWMHACMHFKVGESDSKVFLGYMYVIVPCDRLHVRDSALTKFWTCSLEDTHKNNKKHQIYIV